MSRRPDPAWLTEITDVAEKWLRRCNGRPEEGKLVDRAGLRAVLAMSTGVAVDDDGTITWLAAAGKFTAEPVRDVAPDAGLECEA